MKDLYVQYGCGLCAPEEWLNFDVSPTLRLQRIPLIGRMLSDRLNTRFPKNVRYGDIVGGLPLPAQSCKGIYCSHVLEHLALADLRRTLANTRFLLQPGGIFRLVTPDLEMMAGEYVNKTKQGQPDAAMDFIEETGFGQEERSRSLRAVAEFMYGNARHFWLWDKAAMKQELERAGFTGIREAEFNDCRDPHFRFVEEKHRFHRAFCLEAALY